MKRPAIFIDRDGTINEQMGYINHFSRFNILPCASEAIRLLNNNNYLVIVVTNQSGIARGYYPRELVEEIHTYMADTLKKEGSDIDAVLYCPHHPNGKLKGLSVKCNCRKPDIGMIKQAQDMFDIDLSKSYMIGDYYTDLEFAINGNIKSVLVKTGYGMGQLEYVLPGLPYKPDHVADDLLDAVKWILAER